MPQRVFAGVRKQDLISDLLDIASLNGIPGGEPDAVLVQRAILILAGGSWIRVFADHFLQHLYGFPMS